MNIKRIISLALVAVTLVSVMSFTGCDLLDQLLGETPDNTPAGKNTLVMEAEYTDMEDVAGAGISDGTSGLSMIFGQATEEQKEMWSGGYYVGYMHNSNTVITFDFNSTKATSATLTFSIGCELNDMVLISGENLDILVNGEQQIFTWSVTCSEMDTAKFYEYKLNVELKEGANKIELKVLPQDPPRGPLLDCVKVVASDSTAELSWNPLTDNPDRRNEV